MEDYNDLYDVYEAKQEQSYNNCPVCCCCHERITAEKAIRYDGEWYCEDCEKEFTDLMVKEYTEAIEQ